MSQLKLNLKSVNDDLVIDLFPLGFRADDSSLNCQGRLKRDLETVPHRPNPRNDPRTLFIFK